MVLTDIKRISKNAIGFGIGTFLTQMIGFFLIPIYTHYLTPADYGLISIAAVIGSVLSIIFIFGQNGSLSRFYYEFKESEDQFNVYLSTIIIFTFCVTLIITIILSLSGAYFFPFVEKDLPFNPYILLVLWTTFLNIPLIIYLTLCQVEEKAFFYSILNVIQFILTTGFIIYFVVFLREGAFGNIFAQFLIAIIFLGVTIYLLRNNLKLTLNLKYLKESLSFGIPLMPHSLAGWIISLIDRLFLNQFFGLAVVGIYSLGYSFSNIVGFAAGAINFAWVPYFMSTATERGELAKKDFAIITTYYVVLLFFIALGVAILSKDIIILITPASYHDAYLVIPILVGAFTIGGLYYMVTNQLFLVKKTKVLPFITGGSAIFIIILNLLLIPIYGMIGAALATFFSYLFTFCLTFYMSHKYYPISYEYNRIFKIIFVSIIIFIVCSIINLNNIIFDLVLKTLFIVFVYCLGLILIGFLTKEEIHAINKIIKNFIKHS